MKASKGLMSSWFKAGEDKDKFAAMIKGSGQVLDRLTEILKDKRSNNEVFRTEDYKDGSWAYRAADRNGYIRALEEIINLINEGRS